MNAIYVSAPGDPADSSNVLDVFHREIVRRLDRLVGLARTTKAGVEETDRVEAGALCAFFEGPAREHHEDEERHAFATLLQCDDARVRRAAELLREDHAWIELSWLDIEPQLAAIAAGAPAIDHRALCAAADVFAGQTRDHIALEESLLSP